jgi:hypothetical protein
MTELSTSVTELNRLLGEILGGDTTLVSDEAVIQSCINMIHSAVITPEEESNMSESHRMSSIDHTRNVFNFLVNFCAAQNGWPPLAYESGSMKLPIPYIENLVELLLLDVAVEDAELLGLFIAQLPPPLASKIIEEIHKGVLR